MIDASNDRHQRAEPRLQVGALERLHIAVDGRALCGRLVADEDAYDDVAGLRACNNGPLERCAKCSQTLLARIRQPAQRTVATPVTSDARCAARMVVESHTDPNCADEDPALRLTHEEHGELEEQLDVEEIDRAKLARELADVTYLYYGTALVHGIDLNAAVREVHRAATGKRDATVRREDGKLIRPPGFRTPDMAAAIGRGRWYLCGNCGTISPDDWEAFKRDDDGLLLPAGPSDYGPGDPLPGLPV